MAAGIITILAALIPLFVELIKRAVTAHDNPVNVAERTDENFQKLIATHDVNGMSKLIDQRLQELHSNPSGQANKI